MGTESALPPGAVDLLVADVVEETADACSILFEPAADRPLDYKPGQFLTLAVPSERTGLVARCYSLSSSPEDGGLLKVTVKRTAGGYASNWLCDNLRPGDSVKVLPPSGVFTPKPADTDLLLFAGGSGVTPIISIARNALRTTDRGVVLLYANRDESSVIFAREWAELAAQYPDRLLVVHWLESVQGLPTADQLQAFAARFSAHEAFICGPGPFMDAVVEALKGAGFPRERRHVEKFKSLEGNPFGGDQVDAEEDEDGAAVSSQDDAGPTGPVRLIVEIDGATHEFDDWQPGTKMLDYVEGKGVSAPFSCRSGECSACACRIVEGEVRMLYNDILEDEDLADGIRLACQAVPVTEKVHITYE